MTTPLVLGIDFGTCRTSAAVRIGSEIHSVTFDSGDSKNDMPTAVFVESDGSFLVGEDAENGMLRDPSRFFERFKPDLGRQGYVHAGGIQIEYRDLVAAVLERVRLTAQNKLNNDKPIVSACITVPTLYVEGGDAWTVMEAAAKQAGFENVQLVREPHAAAIYYDSLLRQVDQGSKPDQITLVYDLGGGTFDPALIQRKDGGYNILGAISGEEGVRCGGIYFDEAIRRDFARKCPGVLDQMRFDPTGDKSTSSRRRKFRDIQDLRDMLQQAKIQLSQPGVETFRGIEPTEDGEYVLTRSDFDAMISPLLDATLECCDALVRRTGLEWNRIDRILMVGGSCHIPLVRKKIEAFAKDHGASPEICWRRIGTTERFYNPLLAVGLGASLGKVIIPIPEGDVVHPWNDKITYDSFTDPRDGRRYRIVMIGKREWFAENLAFDVRGSLVHDAAYGRLYDWATAKIACPPGWHLPTDEEWMELEMSVGMRSTSVAERGWRTPNRIGDALKSMTGWNTSSGKDEFGFRALPAGYRGGMGSIGFVGGYASFWTSSQDDASNAWCRYIYHDFSVMYRDSSSIHFGFSVRCVKDVP